MLNWIWLCFVVVAVLVAGFTGRLEATSTGAMKAAKDAVMEIALPLMGVWAVWLGVMRLAEQSGLVRLLARALRPIMCRLFPDVPPDHPAMGAMVMNMAANMIGIGNAATPLGLRAMAHLERLNPNPGVASNAMCTFLAISTASIQLVPTSAISILAVVPKSAGGLVFKGSASPHAIWPTAFLASVCATAAGVIAAKLLQRLPIFRIRPAVAAAAGASGPAPAAAEQLVEAETVQPAALRPWGKVLLGLFFTVFLWFLIVLAFRDAVAGWLAPHGFTLPPAPAMLVGKPPLLRLLFSMATLAIPFMLSFFPLYAALRGVRVYEQFVEGAREAFGTAQRVIPYLVAMLVSIAMLREAGVFDMLQRWLGPLFKSVHFPADLLPMVLIRPMSGSATTGIFVELVQRFGPDSLIARTAATIYGSTETTFYVIAIYFGSVAIRQTRHAIAAGLAADITAVIASVLLCRLFFPA